jgi:peptidoglycan/xylan/chitin deacetylase (PgdA/CDA1 family)
MKERKFRLISNVIIVLLFVVLITYIGTSNSNYVFSYQNQDIIYNGNRDSNKVSIMFNVYWGTEYLDGILDVLDRYNVKTTFFVGGQWVEKESEMLNKICSKGHEIGNHGYFHKDQENLSYDQNYDEIKVNHDLVKVTIGFEMNLFAPPSGSFNKSTLESAKNLGYQTIMWSKDTIDWRDKDANIIFKRATEGVVGGDLILAHPTEHTLKALPLILEYLKVNNIKATTVSDCLK